MITLVIMDGFGVSKTKKGNAIQTQGIPYLQKLIDKYPDILLEASGNAVGLPKGQMGNSEAGHLTIGSGRRFYQPLERINRAIKDGSFFENKELLGAMDFARKNDSALHVIGLASDGGIHSHINHMKAILEMAEKHGVPRVFVHAILDGRDTGIKSGAGFLADLEKLCNQTGAQIKTICGRAWAMDREKYYDRTKKAYNAIVLGKAKFVGVEPVVEAKESYATGVTDEFLEPTVIGKPMPIKDGDAIVCCNIRKDRMRQILEPLCQPDFDKFGAKKFSNLKIVGLVEYDEELKNIGVAFPDQPLKNSLAKVLSKNGLRQLHISETAKFPHVTYYFDCGREKPYRFEDYKTLDSIKDIKYENHPEMRAYDITNEVLDAIASAKYDFIVVNFPNCDMIGHTGDFDATKQAVKIVDKCAYAIAMGTLIAGGECIITADHGNADEMLMPDGTPKTTHTTNPVPFILATKEKRYLAETGELSNIAPTILEMMGLEIPEEMNTSLLRDKSNKKQQKK